MIPLTVFGFPPTGSNDRKRWFEAVARTEHTFTFFEAPHRISSCLEESQLYFGYRPIMLGRELTKVHEETMFLRSNNLFMAHVERRGEFTVVVGPAKPVDEVVDIVDDSTVWKKFQELAVRRPGATRRDLIAGVAAATGLKRNDVFSALERAKVKG
jgi:16S rRNA (cytidine1402-2'-O)-methyltransferase